MQCAMPSSSEKCGATVARRLFAHSFLGLPTGRFEEGGGYPNVLRVSWTSLCILGRAPLDVSCP
eukprot:1511620-Pyramimonas_sp.AAC.1